MTEISESDSGKQVDDWNPCSITSAQQPNLSQVNTIGCADEGLWIFTLDLKEVGRSEPVHSAKKGMDSLLTSSPTQGP